MGKTTRPSGSGAFDAIDRSEPPGRRTQIIGEPSGFAVAGSSNVVPTKRNFSLGVTTTMVDTRLGLSCVFTVYRSGRSVRLPSLSADRLELPGPGAARVDTFRLANRAVRRPIIVHDGVPNLVRLHVEMSATLLRHPHLFHLFHLSPPVFSSIGLPGSRRGSES